MDVAHLPPPAGPPIEAVHGLRSPVQAPVLHPQRQSHASPGPETASTGFVAWNRYRESPTGADFPANSIQEPPIQERSSNIAVAPAREDGPEIAHLERLRHEAEQYLADVEEQVRSLRSDAENRLAAAEAEVASKLAAADTLACEWLAEAEAERDAIIAAARAEAAAIIVGATDGGDAAQRRPQPLAQERLDLPEHSAFAFSGGVATSGHKASRGSHGSSRVDTLRVVRASAAVRYAQRSEEDPELRIS